MGNRIRSEETTERRWPIWVIRMAVLVSLAFIVLCFVKGTLAIQGESLLARNLRMELYVAPYVIILLTIWKRAKGLAIGIAGVLAGAVLISFPLKALGGMVFLAGPVAGFYFFMLIFHVVIAFGVLSALKDIETVVGIILLVLGVGLTLAYQLTFNGLEERRIEDFPVVTGQPRPQLQRTVVERVSGTPAKDPEGSDVLRPVATEAIFRIHRCAWSYAQSHDRHFPASVTEIGETGCDMQPVKRAESAFGFRIQYAAVSREGESGNGFTVTAVHQSRWRAIGVYFYSDETGILHHQSNRVPTPDDPVFDNSGPLSLRSLYGCLLTYAETHPHSRYPSDIRELKGTSCAYKDYGFEFHSSTQFSDRGFDVEYHPKSDRTGSVHVFEAFARPQDTSRHMRSYFIDQSGVIRGTGEDRVATASDPPVPKAEYRM